LSLSPARSRVLMKYKLSFKFKAVGMVIVTYV
jgi:hypothetical protein